MRYISMLSSFHRLFIWLCRIRDCRGFGVQSPSAYEFIRYVVSEHYPYYAYDDMKALYPKMDSIRRHLYEFYFRLSNYMQSAYWFTNAPLTPELTDYIKAGCHKTVLTNVVQNMDAKNVTLIVSGDGAGHLAEYAVSNATEQSVLVIESIYRIKEMKNIWHRVCKDDRVSIVFDLYYCGVVFFDNRPKQLYKINF